MYRQPNNSIYKTVVILWLTLSVASVVLAAVTWLDLSHRLSEARRAAAVRTELDAILGLVIDGETAQRGFTLSGDEGFLIPIRGAEEILQGRFERLMALIKEDERMLKRMVELRAQAELSLSFQHRVVSMRRLEGLERAAGMVADGEGKQITDRIRVQVTELAGMQKPDPVEGQVDSTRGPLFRASLTSLVAGVLGVGAGVFAFWLARVMLGHQERERRLVEARLQAEQSSREKTVFLANMSHEIRTPMNAILGFGELLAGELREPKLRRFVQGIQTSAMSLLQLINDILDMSKIEAGVMELRLEPTDPREICDFLGTLFAEPTARKGVRLDCTVDGDLPRSLLIDRIRLRQVLVNLVGNAVKFTDSGSIRVQIRGEPQPTRSHVALMIQVEDTGVGIPADKLEAIFKPFVQAGAHLEKEKAGTGLGLSIVRRLTEIMGGTVTAASTMGRGSVFRLRIPNIAISQRLAQRAKPEPSEVPDFNALQPSRILVVDDHLANCELVEGFFAGSHHRLVFGDSGAVAIGKARAFRPDLILLDIRMPGMDGCEALEQIRKIAGLERVPVIAVTASGLPEEGSVLRERFSGYVRKPFSRRDLYDELSEFLPQRSTEEPPVGDTATEPEAGGASPELVLELRRLQVSDWPAIRDSLAINECKGFAAQLASLARVRACPLLAGYAQLLTQHAENYAVLELEAHVAGFPTLVEQLERTGTA